MAIDVAKKRLDAATKILSKTGLVLEFIGATFTDGIRSDAASVYAPAILESVRPSLNADIETGDLVFTVAALQSDSAGVLTSTVLDLSAGDHVVYDGRRTPILRPNVVAPTGAPILYDRLVAGTRVAG